MMHGDALRLWTSFQLRYCLSCADRDDDRLGGVVGAARQICRFRARLEGALEVAQRLGAGLADAGVLVAGGDDVLLAARLDARQGQLLAEDVGQLLHRQFDFEDVAARLIAGLPFAVALLRRGQRLAGLAFALADAAASPCCRSGTAGCRSAAAGC